MDLNKTGWKDRRSCVLLTAYRDLSSAVQCSTSIQLHPSSIAPVSYNVDLSIKHDIALVLHPPAPMSSQDGWGKFIFLTILQNQTIWPLFKVVRKCKMTGIHMLLMINGTPPKSIYEAEPWTSWHDRNSPQTTATCERVIPHVGVHTGSGMSLHVKAIWLISYCVNSNCSLATFCAEDRKKRQTRIFVHDKVN